MTDKQPPYYDELDDVDAFSGYKQAQRQARRAHERENRKDRWSAIGAGILLMLIIYALIQAN